MTPYLAAATRTYTRKEIGKAPKITGLYVLHGTDRRGRDAEYNGKAVNVRRRLQQHAKGPKRFHTVTVYPLPGASASGLDRAERRMIAQRKPKLNRRLVQSRCPPPW